MSDLREKVDAFAKCLALESYQLKISPFARSQTVQDWLSKTREELGEAEEASASGDARHTQEELGDVLANVLLAILAAETQGICTLEGILESITTKLNQRKPWLWDGSAIPTSSEEEMEIWVRVKEKMKIGSGNKSP